MNGVRMRLFLRSAILIVLGAGGALAASFPPPPWAYGDGERGKPHSDDGQPKRVTGSTRSFTLTQIHDSFAPADWYPNEHPRCPRFLSRLAGSLMFEPAPGATSRPGSGMDGAKPSFISNSWTLL
jgi:hypothetical protein